MSSHEVLEQLLARVERHNPALNAIVTLDAERARAQAKAADAALARGVEPGPLHGLPVTVKDAFETQELVTTAGATQLVGHVPAADADAVARLRAAGAVVFGKTNLPRLGLDFQTFNAVFGSTTNPGYMESSCSAQRSSRPTRPQTVAASPVTGVASPSGPCPTRQKSVELATVLGALPTQEIHRRPLSLYEEAARG